MKLYTDNTLIIEQGTKILKLVALIQPFQSTQFILSGALRGAGDTKATAIITFITVLLLRPGLAKFTINSLRWETKESMDSNSYRSSSALFTNSNALSIW